MTSGNSRSGAAANGASCAAPLAMRPQSPDVPTTVSGAAPGWAQPLAQPDRWIVKPSLRYGAAATAISGAMARAAMKAEAQSDAPAQAKTCRRGSSERVTKPRLAAAAKNGAVLLLVNPIAKRPRFGAVRSPCAPAAAAASVSFSSVLASVWPKASPKPQAQEPSHNACKPIGSRHWRGAAPVSMLLAP